MKKILVLMIAAMMTLPVSATQITAEQRHILEIKCKDGRHDPTSPNVITWCAVPNHDTRLDILETEVVDLMHRVNIEEIEAHSEFLYPDKLPGMLHTYTGEFFGLLKEYSPNSFKYYLDFYYEGISVGYLPVTNYMNKANAFKLVVHDAYRMDPYCNDDYTTATYYEAGNPEYMATFVVEMLPPIHSYTSSHIHRINKSLPHKYTGPIYTNTNSGCRLLAGGDHTMTFYPIIETYIINYVDGDNFTSTPIDSIPVY